MKSVNIFLDMDAELVKGSETIESEIDRAVPELATGSSKRYAEEELDQESSKRQKTSESSKLAEEPRDKEADELSQEELQQTMIIVPEQGMNVEALQTKYLIISLVKEKFNSTEPTDDKEKEIWVELKRLFEPNTDDELWKLQKHIHDLTWSSWWIKIMRCPENFLGRYSCRLKDQEDKVFGYILLVKIKLIIKKLKDSKVMIVTIAGSSYNYWLELLLLLKIEEKVLTHVMQPRNGDDSILPGTGARRPGWFEKMESVYSISNCTVACRSKLLRVPCKEVLLTYGGTPMLRHTPDARPCNAMGGH
ncbi:hypothetical protein Tco_0655795 [Tanacetum coccineum]|uniref:Uncharacterized protein n=1 Tax=Tanacetum coccineum TaxID=301880 RepID=A0ABQ4X748_9ASTR